jgi:hypothetical protein
MVSVFQLQFNCFQMYVNNYYGWLVQFNCFQLQFNCLDVLLFVSFCISCFLEAVLAIFLTSVTFL